MKSNLSQNLALKLALMNWIPVVYFKLKEIWPLFSLAKAKKLSSFFFFFFEWKLLNEISVKRP